MSNEYQVRTITGPATEPVSLAEAKTHLRVDHNADDAQIATLITAAREHCEKIAWRAFITQTLELSLSGWPRDNLIRLPMPPLVSVTSIVYYDEYNAAATMPNTDYIVVTDTEPGLITLARDKTWPTPTLRTVAPIRVRYVAGYGAAVNVPSRYRQAILLLVGHWYENREAVNIGNIVNTLPMAVDSLLLSDRGW
jgi:uncharacterized phiE125 gp8 family phage protein